MIHSLINDQKDMRAFLSPLPDASTILKGTQLDNTYYAILIEGNFWNEQLPFLGHKREKNG